MVYFMEDRRTLILSSINCGARLGRLGAKESCKKPYSVLTVLLDCDRLVIFGSFGSPPKLSAFGLLIYGIQTYIKLPSDIDQPYQECRISYGKFGAVEKNSARRFPLGFKAIENRRLLTRKRLGLLITSSGSQTQATGSSCANFPQTEFHLSFILITPLPGWIISRDE